MFQHRRKGIGERMFGRCRWNEKTTETQSVGRLRPCTTPSSRWSYWAWLTRWLALSQAATATVPPPGAMWYHTTSCRIGAHCLIQLSSFDRYESVNEMDMSELCVVQQKKNCSNVRCVALIFENVIHEHCSCTSKCSWGLDVVINQQAVPARSVGMIVVNLFWIYTSINKSSINNILLYLHTTNNLLCLDTYGFLRTSQGFILADMMTVQFIFCKGLCRLQIILVCRTFRAMLPPRLSWTRRIYARGTGVGLSF